MATCRCGCGQTPGPAKQSDTKRGLVRGQPYHFVFGHQNRGRQRAGVLSADARRRISESKLGEKHPLWKGDEASEKAFHVWLLRNFPKTGTCDWCQREAKTEYAFIADGPDERGPYTRDRDDYAELCIPCHRSFDSRRRREAA